MICVPCWENKFPFLECGNILSIPRRLPPDRQSRAESRPSILWRKEAFEFTWLLSQGLCRGQFLPMLFFAQLSKSAVMQPVRRRILKMLWSAADIPVPSRWKARDSLPAAAGFWTFSLLRPRNLSELSSGATKLTPCPLLMYSRSAGTIPLTPVSFCLRQKPCLRSRPGGRKYSAGRSRHLLPVMRNAERQTMRQRLPQTCVRMPSACAAEF